MSDSLLQSALREMQVLARSGRLWMTFAAVVLLFAITGPYGTAEQLGFLPRFAYWLLLHAGAWFFGLTFSVTADVALASVLDSMFVRLLIGSSLAALPIGLVISLSELSWFGTPLNWDGYLEATVMTLPLAAIFCVISYLAMSGASLAEPEASAQPAASEMPADNHIPLLDRLSVENRGHLLHISVEDHYSRIQTSRGNELILLRFSDAIRETGKADGLQVHRSHWVARDFIEAFQSSNGKLTLLLKDGTTVPVSRSHAAKVRQEITRGNGGNLEQTPRST